MAKIQLSPKDITQFRTALKCYETRQYKKGLKAIESVIEKHPEHGESIALKGILLHSLGQIKEGYENVRLGLRHDVASGVCWHIYGLVCKADKDYVQAAKCYINAQKLEKGNTSLLRDLALLQSQLRQFKPLADTRNSLLQSNPGVRGNWSALAVAQYLRGEYASSFKILDAFESTISQGIPVDSQEESESQLFINLVILKKDGASAAYDHLLSEEKKIIDRTTFLEIKVEYELALKKLEEAKTTLISLLDRNSDNHGYFHKLQQAYGYEDEKHNVLNLDKWLSLYDKLAALYPRSDCPKRMPLDSLTGDLFAKRADSYLRTKLKRGIPSVFVDIKSLYKDASKRENVEKLVSGYASSLSDHAKFSTTDTEVQIPTTLLWTYYYLAQHFDYKRELSQAEHYISLAIQHTPTLVELYMTKARIFKHQGKLQEAMETMDFARKLDLQDRFVNNKCAKYMLRNHENELAATTVGLFTRNEAVGGSVGDLADMQCVWYLLEDAKSFYRQKKYAMALKRFSTVFSIFEAWADDQFDFHFFAFRKNSLRTYLDVLSWEDGVFNNPAFREASQLAIQIYLDLFDHPFARYGPKPADYDKLLQGNLDEEERKKTMKKLKKDLSKRQERAEKIKETDKARAKSEDGTPVKFDEDPLGEELVATNTPLKDAQKYMDKLLSIPIENSETLLLAAKLYGRQGDLEAANRYLEQATQILGQDHVSIIEVRESLTARGD
ncbi:NatA N-acetyltransferase complex subunit [Schizosaccharomyces cryophilus OY26]|uniref:NatA N-acetyltransferase complex subunit n=1 Tax=Schizosaccharomyces cryophilus (strain OY26 / ATCC MYA-4695 / CBS 11777 / NBRC 106824 / NRRL Y48691) TaxID=653667 RepID=S9VWR6_SCHCR|nr:NatA N-acetyltransferase complex subunit [Schizosaccharomyces cryophilus OY26]EPY52093.1 NatA N-acetyltransferase complex subunit [Schizosaccharomyces cryophilus OY26]